jgi:predicted O-methyltransferase YrrM
MKSTFNHLNAKYPALGELLSATELTGKTGKKVSTCGFSTLNNLWVLSCLFQEIKPSRTLEVGMALGASATLFSCMHRQQNPQAVAVHHAIDPFQSEHYDSCTPVFLEKNNLEGVTVLHEKLSSLVLPSLVEQGLKFGLIYIDGSHLFEDTFIDFYYSAMLCEVGGYIALDDCRDSHGLKLVRFVRTNLQDFFEEVSPYRYQVGSKAKRMLKEIVAKPLGQQQMVVFCKKREGCRDWNTKKLSAF